MPPPWLQSQTNAFLVVSVGLLALALLVVWWRERTRRWVYFLLATFVLAAILTWSAGQLFEVPDYLVGCPSPVSYTHLRAHETVLDLVCRLLLEKKNTNIHTAVHMAHKYTSQ